MANQAAADVAIDHAGNGLTPAVQAPNEIDENKISYTRHSYHDDWSALQESSDSDDCPTCFETIGDGYTRHEMGHRDSRQHYREELANAQYHNSKRHKHKHGYGEVDMGDGPIL